MSGRPSTERFTGRAAYYARYRPSYPRSLLDDLVSLGAIPKEGRVADIGSGTGIFTKLLLDRGLTVFAVEPNDDMRHIAEELLSRTKGFVSVKGTAEGTGLEERSVDAVTAAQSYHWFESALTRKELRRILEPEGYVVLLWNERQVDADEFARGYESLVTEFSPEHAKIEDDKDDPGRIFGGSSFEKRTYRNDRRLDLDGLKGMAASVSYLPAPGQEGHEEFCSRLRALFDRHEREGGITVSLRTECCFGRLD